MLDEPPVTPIRKASDGLELPATGFGTYKVNGLAGVDAIKSATEKMQQAGLQAGRGRLLHAGPGCRLAGCNRRVHAGR